MDEGDIIYFEECCEEMWFKIKAKITKVEKSENGWRVELKTLLARIIFTAETKGNSCIFTHVERFGFKTPIIGGIVDLLLKFLYPSAFEIIKRDMIEDNKRLKNILEKD